MSTWTILWIAGIIYIVYRRVRAAGVLPGAVASIFPVIGWTIVIPVLIIGGMIFGAFLDAYPS